MPTIEKARKQVLTYIKFCNASGKKIPAYNADAFKYPTKNDEVSVITKSGAIYDFLEKLHRDYDLEHKAFIEQFGTIESTGSLKIIFFSQFDKLMVKIDDRNMKAQSRPGFWFNVLLEFRKIADPEIYYQEHKKLERSNNHERASILAMRHETLRNAITPGRDNQLYKNNFDPLFYKKAVTETAPHLKYHIVNSIPQSRNKATAQLYTDDPATKILDWSYDKATRTFSYKDKEARFRTFKNLDHDKNPRSKDRRAVYGIPSKLLSYLIIDGATKKTRRLPHDEALYEKIVGTNPEKDMRTSISDACKQIKDNIQRKCGLEDFVICEQDVVYINPLYLP